MVTRVARPRRQHRRDGTSWRDLVRAVPALADLEAKARELGRRAREDPSLATEDLWTGVKRELSRRVGWLAVNAPEIASTSGAYDAARAHLWHVLQGGPP